MRRTDILISVEVEGNAHLFQVTPHHLLLTVAQMDVSISLQKKKRLTPLFVSIMSSTSIAMLLLTNASNASFRSRSMAECNGASHCCIYESWKVPQMRESKKSEVLYSIISCVVYVLFLHIWYVIKSLRYEIGMRTIDIIYFENNQRTLIISMLNMLKTSSD